MHCKKSAINIVNYSLFFSNLMMYLPGAVILLQFVCASSFQSGKTLLHKKLEGKTLKLKNPYRKHSLPWAAWLIARLGGWTGYESSAKPGYITIKRGMDVFLNKYDMFQIMEEELGVAQKEPPT